MVKFLCVNGRGKSHTKAHFESGDILIVIKAACKNQEFGTEVLQECEHSHGNKSNFSKKKTYSNLPKKYKTEL